MTLVISILRCPDSVAPQTRKVTGGELSIGRGAENDWILPDPDRVLSKRHCIVAFRQGGWQVADVSSNGTFLNQGAEPIGAGTVQELRDGDRLRLGSYELEVRVETQAQSGLKETLSFGNAVSRVAVSRNSDPFGDDPFGAPRATPDGNSFDDDPLLHPSPHGKNVNFSSAMALPIDFDPFVPHPDDYAFSGPIQADHSPSVADSFHPPDIMRLPDDWDLDFLSSPQSVTAKPLPEAPPALLPVAPPQSTSASAPATPAAVSDCAPPSEDLMAAFLRGAKVNNGRPTEAAASMERLGAAFRAVVSGIRHALIARATVKSEFRIEQTMIRARGNNPLKFSADDDDAMAAMLGLGRVHSMNPADAVTEALNDIRLHELATMAAMQTGVRALLARLDPMPLRIEGEKSGGLLTTQRRARSFELFEKLHGEISQALADDFDSVFGKAFARAYEQALREATDGEKP